MWQLRTKEEDKSLVTETTSLPGGPGTLTLVKEQALVLSLLNVELELLKSLWIRNQRSGRALGCLRSQHSLSKAVWRFQGSPKPSRGSPEPVQAGDGWGGLLKPLPRPAPRMDGTQQSPLVPWLLELCSLFSGSLETGNK